MIDTKNMEIRYVETPDGPGVMIGMDDKENPNMVVVKFEGPTFKAYQVESVNEVESNGK